MQFFKLQLPKTKWTLISLHLSNLVNVLTSAHPTEISSGQVSKIYFEQKYFLVLIAIFFVAFIHGNLPLITLDRLAAVCALKPAQEASPACVDTSHSFHCHYNSRISIFAACKNLYW